MVTYLKDHGVDFQYETKVTDVQFRIEGGKKQASSVTVDHKGESRTIDLTENDLLFITNGGCVESCTIGAQDKAAGFDPTIRPGNGWDLWKKIACTGSFLRPSRKVLLSAGAVQLGKRHHHHPGRQDPPVYQEDLQA